MAVMIAVKAPSSTEDANHDTIIIVREKIKKGIGEKSRKAGKTIED